MKLLQLGREEEAWGCWEEQGDLGRVTLPGSVHPRLQTSWPGPRINPSHSLLIPWVTDHQTFFLACSVKVHHLGYYEKLSAVQPPLAWLASVPPLVGFARILTASAAQREEVDLRPTADLIRA